MDQQLPMDSFLGPFAPYMTCDRWSLCIVSLKFEILLIFQSQFRKRFNMYITYRHTPNTRRSCVADVCNLAMVSSGNVIQIVLTPVFLKRQWQP